jgi:hypothetical protein
MIRPDGASWSGVQDRFGERATGVDADGRSVDLLRLFEAFTPASRPLLDRITLLDVDRPAIGRAIALERDEESGRLILISEHVPGVRLSELLRTAVLRSVVADLGAALFVMRRLLMLAESLKAATGLAHFSIAPERIVITPHGRVVIVEPVLGAAAETDATGSDDIAAIAIAGMSIMLGHLIEDAEHIDPMSPVLQDAADVAAIRAGSTFSTALRLWFDRAVIADPALSFPDFRQARLALAHVVLARESGCDASRRALKVFLNDLAIERLTDVEASALESNRLREIRAKRLARWKAISAPDEEWIAVEHELLIGDEPRIVEEQFHGAVVDLDERADLDQRADEAIGIGPLAEPGMAAPGEESLEAVVVEEPIEAEPEEEPIEAAALVEWPIEVEPAEEPTEADPAPSSRSWIRSMARQLGLASAEPQPRETDLAAPPGDAPLESPLPELSTGTIADPAAADIEIAAWSSTVSAEPEVGEEQIEIGHAEPPVETIEEPFTEEAEPVAVDTLDQSPPMEPAIEAQGERPAEVAQDLTAFAAEEYESASIASESDAEPETLEQPARSLAEPVTAESWNAWTGGISEESIAPRVDDGPADAVQEEPARAVGAEVPSETIDAPLEEDEPVAPVDESIAAKLAEDAHRSWIQSITDQLGRMRRPEEVPREPPAETTAGARDGTPLVHHTETESPDDLRGTVDEIEALFAEDAADTPAVEAAPIQLEPAAMPHVEERTGQPAAWAKPEPAPWRDNAGATGTVMPFPAKPVDHEYAPHQGVLHKRVADAQPHGPAAQPARWAPSPRTIVVPPRRWTRVAATILLAGLGLAFVAALAIAGRSYYRSATTPGTIAVDSTPSGSEVLVDGTPRGVTPLTLTLQPGDYVLALRRNGLTRQYPIAVKPRAQLSQHLDWSTVRATGTLAISSTPSQAKVTVDGKARGVTPLTLSDVPVGVRRIVIESSAGTVRREVRVVEGSQVTIDEAIIPGWIAAFAPFELQIYDGTRLLGAMEDGRIRVPPGRHELDFVNTRLGFRERRGIDVTPGMTTAVNIGAVAGIVRITAPAGADVLIDGVLFGDTPIRELRLPIGAHEIVLRHPQLGEQRVSVTVGASAPTEVTIDFTKR